LGIAEDRKTLARDYLLRALNLEATLAVGAEDPRFHIGTVLRLLSELEDPVPGAKAWLARIPPGSQPQELANQTLLIFAVDRHFAVEYASQILGALVPSRAEVLSGGLVWSEAPRHRQPAGLANLGVVGFL